MILEKAFARAYGSYNKISNNLTNIGINILTGAPYEYYIKDNKKNIKS
jgi:hypothetical protein